MSSINSISGSVATSGIDPGNSVAIFAEKQALGAQAEGVLPLVQAATTAQNTQQTVNAAHLGQHVDVLA